MTIEFSDSERADVPHVEAVVGSEFAEVSVQFDVEGNAPRLRLEDLRLVRDGRAAELDDEDLAHVVYSEFSTTYSSVRSQPKASPVPSPSRSSAKRSRR